MPATGFSPIQLFHSSTSGTLPTTSQLFTGEVFWNIADNKVYGLNTAGTALQTIVGSLGNQNANTVAITGGTINGTTIGATTPSTGVFTTLVANTSVLSPIVGAGTGSNLSLQANATTWATLFQSGGLSLGNTTDPGAGNLSVSGNIISFGYLETKTGNSVTLANSLNSNLTITTNSGFFTFTGGGSSCQLGGMVAGIDGQRIVILNTTGSAITILGENTSSTASNRIWMGGLTSVTWTNLGSREFIYSGTNSRWLMIGSVSA